MADTPEMESLSVEQRMMANLDFPEDELPETEAVEATEAAENSTDEEATDTAPEKASDDGEAEAEEELSVITIDGQDYEVPKPLESAFMLQKDATQKTMAAAERQRMLDERETQMTLQAQFQQQFNEQIGVISNIDAQIKQYEAVDWATLQANDPVQFVTLKEQYRDLKDARNYYTNDLNQKQQQSAIQAQQHYAKLKEQGVRDLQNSIKGWGEERAREIRNFGMESYGFLETELSSIIDPRMVKVLHDAYLYRKGASVSTKKVIGKPQIGKPKAQVSQAKETTLQVRQALKKTGNQKFAAKAIESLI
jgi:hypothetical protein